MSRKYLAAKRINWNVNIKFRSFLTHSCVVRDTRVHYIYDFIHIRTQLRIRESVDCKVLCTVDLTSEQTDMFIEKIDEDYTVHM